MSDWRWIFLGLVLTLLGGCEHKSQVAQANADGILIIANSNEPKGLDPHLVSGVLESNLLRSMFEGLVAFDERDDIGGRLAAAEELTPDATATVWTAKLRPNGKWSDGTPVTAEDFVFSYRRMLTPRLGAGYADMLYFLDGAEAFHKTQRGRVMFERRSMASGPTWSEVAEVGFGPLASVTASELEEIAERQWDDMNSAKRRIFVRSMGLDRLDVTQLRWIAEDPIARYEWPQGFELQQIVLERLIESHAGDFWELANVGVKALDPLTLQLTLRGPTPYFQELLKHYTWTAVPKHAVLKFGKMDDRGNPWTRPENIVGNGPYQLKSWRINDHIEVERNPHYWDAENVTLNGVRFLPIQNPYTEARMFRDGQLHITYSAPAEVVDLMKETNPSVLRQEPYTGTVFYRFNTTRKPLNDPRVRQALTLAIDRAAICENVFRGYRPAHAMTPPMGNYQPPEVATFDPERARQLLAEAGYADPRQFPRLKVLIASRETSDTLAQAVQAMWRKNLGIQVQIENKEWTAYLVATQQLDYDISGGGWIGDYLDPLTFLEMWMPGNGNNNTGWSNEQFAGLLKQSFAESSPDKRFQLLHDAEKLMLEEAPVAVMAWYAKNYLVDPAVVGWYPLLLDNHPYQYMSLKRDAEPGK